MCSVLIWTRLQHIVLMGLSLLIELTSIFVRGETYTPAINEGHDYVYNYFMISAIINNLQFYVSIWGADTACTNDGILTTNLAAVVCVCVCVCVRKIWPISALTLLFRIHTSRKFCSHSKIPIRCLWTAFCVPLSLIFYDKRWFRIQIVTVRRSRFAALWQIINSPNPFSRRGWMARGQRIT